MIRDEKDANLRPLNLVWCAARGDPTLAKLMVDISAHRHTDIHLKRSPYAVMFQILFFQTVSGEAYVQFQTEEDCNKAKQKHNDKVGARYIEVFPASGKFVPPFVCSGLSAQRLDWPDTSYS